MNKKGLYIVVLYNNEKEVITFIKDVLHKQENDLDIYVVVNSIQIIPNTNIKYKVNSVISTFIIFISLMLCFL